jgi:SPP1 family predicted phage head-tail adaptor
VINAGALNRRVEFQTQVTTQDSIGQPSTSWTTNFSAWASIKYQSGSSAIKSGADASINKCSIRLRYRTGIDARMRVLHGTTAYNITAILPAQDRAFIDLVCEVVNAAV